MKRLVPVVVLLAASAASAAPPPAVEREIEGLFAALERSGCRFSRNGTWYEAPRARDHLRRKYAWLRDRDALRSTEQFIALAATKSSMTGRAYEVRCGAAPAQPSRAWFERELARLRAGR